MADEEYKISIKCKDFDGKVCLEFHTKTPLQFPYLFYKNRLFVSSRDELGVLLERSYHVFTLAPKPSTTEKQEIKLAKGVQ